MEEFVSNWRTTVVGAVGGVVSILIPIVQDGRKLSSDDWILALVLFFLGLFAKDAKREDGLL